MDNISVIFSYINKTKKKQKVIARNVGKIELFPIVQTKIRRFISVFMFILKLF